MFQKLFFLAILGLCATLVLGQTFNQQCLAAHNKYRALHGAPNLKLNATISQFAKRWANRLANLGKLEHRTNNPYGENLYAQFGGTSPNCAVAVKAWYDEISKYNFSNPGFSSATGHFTQVVWKGSRQLGCGRTKSGSDFYVVCNYSPPGNVQGQFPANVLKKQ